MPWVIIDIKHIQVSITYDLFWTRMYLWDAQLANLEENRSIQIRLVKLSRME